MAELAELRGSTGLVALSSFSGCGGSCLGLEWAGYRIAWASEFVPAAAEVYRLNHPDVPLDTRDIRLAKIDEILRDAGVRAGEVDLMEGSPPCSSFSMAGARSRKWGEVSRYSDTKQRTDDLFWEYTRVLRGVQPRAFVAENVSGLVKGVARGYFREILAMLKDSGYRVRAQMLDAQWLGVPQMRQRVIFVGIRNDLNRDPVFPTPYRYRYSVRDALPWLAAGSQQAASNRTQFGEPTLWQDTGSNPSPTIGASESFPNANASPGMVRDGYVRAGGDARSLDEPSPTVLTYGRAHTQSELVVVEARITGRTGPQFTRVESELDEPFNTVQASDPEQTRYEVTERLVHGSGGFNGRLNGKPVKLDRPIRTVRATISGNQFQFEPTVHHGEHIHQLDQVGEDVGASMNGYAIEREWYRLHPGETSDKYLNLARAHPDQPSPTVTAQGAGGGPTSAGVPGGVASVTHPFEPRKFSIGELKRICGFPDDFELSGTYAQQWERLGRSVPPPMMRAIGDALCPLLLETR